MLHIVYFEPPANSSTIQNFDFARLSRIIRYIFHDFQKQTFFQKFPHPENQGKKIKKFPEDSFASVLCRE